ncbi:MAG: hypothetical protein HRT35_34530, partial [Algicola sp.]|nr:hypothetical protein [Algicola sp.]
SSGQKVAQNGVGYDPALAEISTVLSAGTYYVVAATEAAGVSGDFEVKLIGGQFSAFVPHLVAFDVLPVETNQDAVDINITIPISILGGIQNVVFSYVVNGVSTTVDLAALGCTIGLPCTISIDTQGLSSNATIEWRLTADILEGGQWVNSELANEQTLVNLDLLQLNDFKTDTYYAPVTVNLTDPVLLEAYENFRLKYSYKDDNRYSRFEQFEQPITVQEPSLELDLSDITKIMNDYEDSGKLFVQVIADKKAKEGAAAVNDVILDSSEKIYDAQPRIKLREAFSIDGLFKFSALIPGWMGESQIFYIPELPEYGNAEWIRFYPVAGPEYVDYAIDVSTTGYTNFRVVGRDWSTSRNWGNGVSASVRHPLAPQLSLTATNSDVFANQNGTLATANWRRGSPLDQYCPRLNCDIKLQYRMLDDLGVATPWKSYLLDSLYEFKGETPRESLWFDNIESGIVEVKLVSQYYVDGATEPTTLLIAEASVVVAPSTTFIPPDNMQLPDNPTQWLYSINGQTSTDTQYDVSMTWPMANDDTFSLAQFIDDSWQLIYNGSVNAWSGTLSNLTQAAQVKLKLTSCQGGTCNETLKQIDVNSDVTFTAVTTETSDVFEFRWFIEDAQADYVRIFYTEDEALFDSAVDQGWQELSYGTGMPDTTANDAHSQGKGYLRHSPNVMKAAFRVFACSNSGYCFTAPKTNVVNFPLAPVWAIHSSKGSKSFAIYIKPYRDGNYLYKYNVENVVNHSSAEYINSLNHVNVRLSDLDMTNVYDVFFVTSSARNVDMSSHYGDPSSDHRGIVYVSGDTEAPSARLISSPGCHRSNAGCATELVDPFDPGLVSAIFSHPSGVARAYLYIESATTGVKRKLESDIVKSDTVWQLTANIGDTGALEAERGYKIYIEGTSTSNSTVVSDHHYVVADSSLVPGPTSISLTGDASAIVFSWNADVEQNPYFTGYAYTFGNSLRNYNSYTRHNPDNSGSFGVKACYYFDGITGSSVHNCSSYIYVDYALENGRAVCSGAACNQPEPEPEPESGAIIIHTQLLGAPVAGNN